MPRNRSLNRIYSEWQRRYAADAVADDCAEIARHIEYLGLNCTRAAMLEGTDLLLQGVMAYLELDGRDCESLLRKQRYRLDGEGLPFYCLTFNFGKGHFGRILTDEPISEVDFADLFNHPWYPYKTAGFHEVHISRLDGEPIGNGEFECLERRFTEDMFCDYSDDEIAAYVQTTELEDTVLATAVEHI